MMNEPNQPSSSHPPRKQNTFFLLLVTVVAGLQFILNVIQTIQHYVQKTNDSILGDIAYVLVALLIFLIGFRYMRKSQRGEATATVGVLNITAAVLLALVVIGVAILIFSI